MRNVVGSLDICDDLTHSSISFLSIGRLRYNLSRLVEYLNSYRSLLLFLLIVAAAATDRPVDSISNEIDFSLYFFLSHHFTRMIRRFLDFASIRRTRKWLLSVNMCVN